MPSRERGETGQFVESVRLEDVLAVFNQVRGPVITSSDVAKSLDCTTEAARQKLARLHDQGQVEKRKTGRTVVYWLTESSGPVEPEQTTSSRENQETRGADRQEKTKKSQRENTRTSGQTDAPTSLDEVDFPAGRERDQCEAAVLAARDYLREHGPATMRELVTEVMPEHPVGYDIPELEPGDRYRGAWWRRVVKPGLQALPDVQAPSRGASDWRYNPDTGTERTSDG
jgi:hypothetical protein